MKFKLHQKPIPKTLALLCALAIFSLSGCGNKRQPQFDVPADEPTPGTISAEIYTNIQSTMEELTHKQAREWIIDAALEYRGGLLPGDLLEGAPGENGGDATVTHAEALVMLSNAFGAFPEPKGDNLRRAAGFAEYTDAPGWANAAIENLNSGLLLVPTEDKLLKPDEAISGKELDTYLRRIYALYGTRLEDDFYAAVNKDWLDSSELPEGAKHTNPLEEMQKKATAQIDNILDEILGGTWETDTPERKIVDYYQAYIDKEARDKTGAAPIKPYLDQLAAVKDLQSLNEALASLASETVCFPYIRFRLQADYQDSEKNAVYLTSVTDVEPPENPAETIGETLRLAGAEHPEETGALAADIQTRLEEAYKDIPDPYSFTDEELLAKHKRITMAEAKALIPDVDLDAMLAAAGLKPEAEYYIRDDHEAGLKALTGLYTSENAPALAALAQYKLVDEYKRYMGALFAEPGAAEQTPEELAHEAREDIKGTFEGYLGALYGKRYGSAETKADVTELAKEFIEVYESNIQNLDWMSEDTKQVAVQKLDKMLLLIAYPDQPDTFLDGLAVGDISNGGSFLWNQIEVWRRRMQESAEGQGKPASRVIWRASVYMANASAVPDKNGIVVPAGILQAPFYSPDASLEENLAGIGWAIAHEITHNFDPTGSQYNETGGLTDWWAAGDKAKFTALCGDVSDFYAGMELSPCRPTGGTNQR